MVWLLSLLDVEWHSCRVDHVDQTSHPIPIAGNRVLVSYEGQPLTCYGCNGTDDLYHACPMRRRTERKATTEHATSWADIAANGAGGTGKNREVAIGGAQHINPTEHAEKIYAEVNEELSAHRRLILQKERELLNNTVLEKTCRSESSVTKAFAEVVPTLEEVDPTECGAMEQEEETVDTRRTTLTTLQ